MPAVLLQEMQSDIVNRSDLGMTEEEHCEACYQYMLDAHEPAGAWSVSDDGRADSKAHEVNELDEDGPTLHGVLGKRATLVSRQHQLIHTLSGV